MMEPGTTAHGPIDYRAFPILVVDDEPEILRTFEFNYRRDFTILTSTNADEALALVREHEVALVLADQRMPGRNGVELLTEARMLRPEALRLILTGYTDMETLVRGVNEGKIYRYITKPWDSAELRFILRQAIETFAIARANRLANERLLEENRYLRRREAETVGAHGMIGTSAPMQRVFELIERVRDAPTPVLVQGETGTGKELVARAIHEGGAYRDRLFVAQNCGALTESLLESELFGHRRGAFTGAIADKKGLFELADQGTLFLDEISETGMSFQVKLLRVLEDGEIRPVGDVRGRRVQVRVVAASNRDLAAEVAAGRFRADLYYRLNVFPIVLPPLRERRDDVPALAAAFVARHAERLGRRIDGLAPSAMAVLTSYDYPGNVRELENEMERAVLLADENDAITEDLFSDRILTAHARAQHSNGQPPTTLAGLVAEFERTRILETLAEARGNKSEAARRFGLTYRGLLAKMQRLGLA
jgi:two-component system, NtrC family, response regulator HupR/HoxA